MRKRLESMTPTLTLYGGLERSPANRPTTQARPEAHDDPRRRGLQDKVRKSKRRERIFATTEDAIATRTERGLTPAAAKLLK